MTLNTRAIHFRLIVWYSSLIIAVSLAFGAYTYHGVQVRLYGEMEQTLTRRAKQIADNILPTISHESQTNIANQIQALFSPEANNRFIRILRSDRSLFYVSGTPKDERFDPQKVPVPVASPPARQIIPLTSDLDMLMVTLPVEAGGESFLIEMGVPTGDMEATLHGLIMTLLIGLPVVILIVSAGGYVLVQRSLQPVEDIRATAEQITFGNLSNRLPVAVTGDALEHLSVTLNQMLDRLEDAYQQVSRFSADASHELRTPLTIMRGELEYVVREPQLPETLRECIGSVLEETERLSRITENLFAISRLDAGEAKIEHIQFDLATLVQSTADQMMLMAEVKKIRTSITASGPTLLYGDPSRIKQIIVNLLDNAIKYTNEGGSIALRISTVHHKALLEVIDNGVGIPADALPHVFERFYRADKIRSRDIDGAGLGLSIVRSIVLAHGGTIDIQSVKGKGTTCKVELPLASVQESGV